MQENRNKSFQYNLFVIACIYYLADLLLPMIQYYSSVYVNIFFVLVILFTVFSNLHTVKKLLPPFIFIITLTFIDQLLTVESIKDLVLAFYKTTLIFIPIVLGIYLIYNNNYKLIRLLILTSLILLSITSITSVIGLNIFPLASRELATGMINNPNSIIYSKMNIGGFNLVYMIPVILPIIVAMFFSKKIKLISLLLFTLPLMYFVYQAQYTTAIISLVTVIISLFVFYKYSHLKLILVSFVIVPVVLLFGSQFFVVFQEVADTQTYEVSERLNALIEFVQGGKTESITITGREEKFSKSLNSFVSSPIIGARVYNANAVGGHSFILDILGAYGLIGIFALYIFYRQIFHIFYRAYKKQHYYGYMILSLSISIFLSVVNTSPNIFAIGFFVPLVAYSIQHQSKSKPFRPTNLNNKL